MAIDFIQVPASCSLAQSPMVFAVSESVSGLIGSSSFQYVGELYYWTGNDNESGSFADFTFTKYPNTSLSGIFDVSKVINATLQTPVQENQSQVVKYKMDFYHQWVSASVNVTGSHVESEIYKAIDGYGIFQENITQSLDEKTPFWPIMTDGPSTQSTFANNVGRMSVFNTSGSGDIPDAILYSGGIQSSSFALPYSENTSGSITTFPIGDGEVDFPLSSSYDFFTITPLKGGSAIGDEIRFEVECEKKYPNIRIKWKNRYGQFDYLNFSLVSQQSFNADIKTYESQLGTWDSKSLTYNKYDSATRNYIADSKESIKVNSDWLSEDYNDILKQLLVSDEIYWIYGSTGDDVRPLTLKTNSINFLTNVKDKLIQYSFEFEYGQTYKLVL
jgi:hypothetical protein